MFHIRFIKIAIFLIISLKSFAAQKPVLPNALIPVYDSAKLMINQKNYIKAFDYLNKLKSASDIKGNNYLQAATELLEGGIYFNLQFYDKAEVHYLASREMFEKTNQKNMVCLVTYILGSVAESANTDAQKQYSYFKKALELALELKDTIRIITSFDAVGCSLSKLQEYDKAIENSKEAERVMLLTDASIFDPNIYTNIAEFYYKKGDYINARINIDKAIKRYDKRDDTNFINDAFRIAGNTYLKLGNTQKSMEYLNKALNYCRKNIDDPLLSKKTFDAVIEQLAQNGNYKKAFELQKEYVVLKDSSSRKETALRLNQNQVLLEVNNRNKERELLLNSLAIEQSQNKFTLGITVLLASLLIAIVFLYWEKKNFNQKLKTEVDFQTAALLQSNAELERFAFIASHDLKTPLRNIISFSGLLHRKLKDTEDTDIRQFITFIKDYAYHMNNIIHDILDFSKIGKAEHENVEVLDLNDIKEKVMYTLNDKIKQHNAVIHTEGVLPVVKADKTHVMQLMTNLVENAIMYNESKRPEITIGVKNDEKSGVHIFVKDNGIGIDPQYQAKVFEMFTRLHGIEKYSGTGLGLAICKKIVVQYGGRIWIDSALGRGTTVNFALPAA